MANVCLICVGCGLTGSAGKGPEGQANQAPTGGAMLHPLEILHELISQAIRPALLSLSRILLFAGDVIIWARRHLTLSQCKRLPGEPARKNRGGKKTKVWICLFVCLFGERLPCGNSPTRQVACFLHHPMMFITSFIHSAFFRFLALSDIRL